MGVIVSSLSLVVVDAPSIRRRLGEHSFANKVESNVIDGYVERDGPRSEDRRRGAPT